MCGIGAIICLKRLQEDTVTESVRNMALELESRGVHATGVCAIHENSFEILKMPVRASIFIETMQFKQFMKKNWHAKAFLVHDRHYTHGNPKHNYNNHPLESENYILIHNGVIRDHELSGMFDAVYKEKAKRINTKVETDSYFILRIAEYLGIEYIPSIQGTNVSIIFDKNQKVLYLFRGSNQGYTLYVGYCPELHMIACASTENALSGAFSRMNKLFNFFDINKKEYKYTKKELKQGDFYKLEIFGRTKFQKIYGSKSYRDGESELMLEEYCYQADVVSVGEIKLVQLKNLPKKVKKKLNAIFQKHGSWYACLLYTSPSPRD